jgi:hypothetical protein
MTQIFSDTAEVLDSIDADEIREIQSQEIDPSNAENVFDVEADETTDEGAKVFEDVEVVALREADVPPEFEGGIDRARMPVRHEDARLLVYSTGGMTIDSGGEAYFGDAGDIMEVSK